MTNSIFNVDVVGFPKRKAKIKMTPVMFNGESKYQYELSGI